MLTSKDLPETYRNVHSEDAEDGRTARLSEDPKKVLARKNVVASLVHGKKMSPQVRSHKHRHTLTTYTDRWAHVGEVQQ